MKKNQVSNDEASIFRLNIDCLEEIFEYLSLIEVTAMGETCKQMQQIAGEYFQRNYKSAEKFSAIDGIYTVYTKRQGVMNQRTQTSIFNQFINYISHYYEEIEPLYYIQLHGDNLSSINHLYLVCLTIDAIKLECLQTVLSKIEILQLKQCRMFGDFNDGFLKYCKKLKRLYIQDDLGDIVDENGNPWLLRQYKTLEFMQMTLRYPFKILELSTFFERNPSIRGFSTSSRCLWENRHELLKSNIQLDRLEIQMLDNFYRQFIDIRLICELLNQLHARGFYQRLHLYVKRIDMKSSELLTMLGGLEHLSIKQFNESFSIHKLIHLKELTIFDGACTSEMDILATGLISLERIQIQNAAFNDIRPFIRRSMKLSKLKLTLKNETHEKTVDIVTLNEERKQLIGARKVTIYLPDHVFLETKWTTNNGNTNLNMVEMKRADSYDWEKRC
ncbi:uncharacterized protein LOC116350375 isoform X2 [Contarinia nasturtii]|nr:uncharacterized protein LOC116350375 isoform X2 [Contarinia nasturtii]XP_031638014.1 uncharacterized protein LOC116350375 isoform X2 [Contarinia nasturtii]